MTMEEPLHFGTKAETLDRLIATDLSGFVKPLRIFTIGEWNSGRAGVLSSIADVFGSSSVVVRSSCRAEDTSSASNAGAFASVLDCCAEDPAVLSAAIDTVIASYPSPDEAEQFFVQEQVLSARMSGVAFTRDLSSGAPYIVVNYDAESSRTDTVTSGTSNALRTYYHYRKAPVTPPTPELEAVVELLGRLEKVFGADAIDVEFAIDASGTLFVLQVRPLAGVPRTERYAEAEFDVYLKKVAKKAKKLSRPHPDLCGDRGVYSVMSDWNPAEMIGFRPRTLALTLYKELITDSTWAYQRDNYGYRNLRSHPLLISYLGIPYIDVRVSFNSFVPKSLGDELAEKLVRYYISRLIAQPESHDKVEFDILFSCYHLNIDDALSVLTENGFTSEESAEIKTALRSLTNSVISPEDGLYRDDLDKLSSLEQRFEEIKAAKLSTIDTIYWLVQDCKRYGTLPFAGLARAGFIAMQLLHSIRDIGIFSEDDYQQFMGSLNTVAAKVSRDVAAMHAGDLAKEEFLVRYGYLRPGTYDINSSRYDEAFEDYFGRSATDREAVQAERGAAFSLSAEKRSALEALLREHDLCCAPEQLLEFIGTAIEGRELGKFVFTRNVSEILRLMGSLGARHGLSVDDMSFVDIETVLSLYSSLRAEDVADVLNRVIEGNRKEFEITNVVQFPQVIVEPSDIYRFHVARSFPNYVTLGRVCERIVRESDFSTQELHKAIVMVASADPGYDWLFSCGIAGLITMYGGANSHMAIRCAELQIPAAIGVGKANFERWSQAEVLELDCSARTVEVVR